MNMFDQNPYRILGIFSNVSQSELIKQKTRQARFLSVGKSETAATDFPFLGTDFSFRTIDSIEEAAKRIEQPEDKLIYSLLWFINHSSVDDIAFEHLRAGNTEKAEAVWRLAVEGKEVSPRNFSCLLNLSSFLIANEAYKYRERERPCVDRDGRPLLINRDVIPYDVGALSEAFALKNRLLNSEGIKLVADIIVDGTLDGKSSSLVGNLDDLAAERLADIILSWSPGSVRLSHPNLIASVSEMSRTMGSHLKSRLTDGPISEFRREIEKARNRVEVDKRDAVKAGIDLNTAGKKLLRKIVGAVGVDDILAETIRNDLAAQILNCSIAYFNEFHESSEINPGDDALRLLELAAGLNPTGEVALRISSNRPIISRYQRIEKIRKETALEKRRIELVISAIGTSPSCSAIYKAALKIQEIISDAKSKAGIRSNSIESLVEHGFVPLFDLTIKQINDLQSTLSSPINDELKLLTVIKLREELLEARKVVELAIREGAKGSFRERLQENLKILKGLISSIPEIKGLAPSNMPQNKPPTTRINVQPYSKSISCRGWLGILVIVFLSIVFVIENVSKKWNSIESKPVQEYAIPSIGMERIQGGMCPTEEPCRVNEIVVIEPFDLDIHEVSRKDFQSFVDGPLFSGERWRFKRPRIGEEELPMSNVTFNEAEQFCSANKKRLPTEQEWEFAARQKVPSDFRSSGTLIPTQSLPPFHLMAGNVSEWVSSEKYRSTNNRVVRGGNYRNLDADIGRKLSLPNMTRQRDIGFRCAKTPEPLN